MAEITNEDDLKAWLEGQDREVAVAIAARTALRVLPLIADYVHNRPANRSTALVSAIFRGTASAWFSGYWPNHAEAIAAAAAAAASAATAAAAHAATARTAAARAAAAHAATSEETVWVEVSADADAVEAGASSDALMRRPLWTSGAPEWIAGKWFMLKSDLLELDEDWGVWTDWYDVRLRSADHPDSRRLIEELERERVLIPDEDWKKGPKHVNAIIAALEMEYNSKRGNGVRQALPKIAINAVGHVDLGNHAQPILQRLNLVAGERPTILSNSNAIARDPVRESLDISAARLKDLKEVLDGYVSQDAVKGGDASTNKIVLPMAEADLVILRHYVELGIQEVQAPRMTQMSVDLFEYDRMLLSQSESIFAAAKGFIIENKELIVAISAVVTALGSTIAAIAAVAGLGSLP